MASLSHESRFPRNVGRHVKLVTQSRDLSTTKAGEVKARALTASKCACCVLAKQQHCARNFQGTHQMTPVTENQPARYMEFTGTKLPTSSLAKYHCILT